ncbi:hypothetical protein P5V15_001267 [Pogonomyrmex californicus]
MDNLGSRLIKWRLKLEEYDYEVVHKASRGNINADALSRNPIALDTQINSIERDKEEREYSKDEKEQILYEYTMLPLEDIKV